MLNSFLWIIVILISIPLSVVSLQLLIVQIFKPKASIDELPVEIVNARVLIPAHNEAVGIAKTLQALLTQVPAELIVVVADNCTDNTAEIARSYKVTVLERVNEHQRSKGFALDYGIQYLHQHVAGLEVLIIMDADCIPAELALKRLYNQVLITNQPAQALYMMLLPENASIKQKIAGFAWRVKNEVRPLAMQYLNLPITLTGTGMAFPWQTFDQVQLGSANIVEDMQLGIDCSLNNFVPKFCHSALVTSYFPAQATAEKTQRTRWEHGHLLTIKQQVPKLLTQAIVTKNWKLLGLALDLSVPPLALLVLLVICTLSVSGIMMLFTGGFLVFAILGLNFLIFSLMLILTWKNYGKDILTFKELCSIPKYILAKLTVYLAFIFKRQTAWVRTERDE